MVLLYLFVLRIFDRVLFEGLVNHTRQVVHQGLQHKKIRPDRDSDINPDLKRRLQIVLIPLRKIFHRSGLFGSLNCRACLFEMSDVLRVRSLASSRMMSFPNFSQNDHWLVLRGGQCVSGGTMTEDLLSYYPV